MRELKSEDAEIQEKGRARFGGSDGYTHFGAACACIPTGGTFCNIIYAAGNIQEKSNVGPVQDWTPIPTSYEECSALCPKEGVPPPVEPQPAIEQPPVCGDGKIGPGEECDDGNNCAGDGCSPSCKRIEPGFDCGE